MVNQYCFRLHGCAVKSLALNGHLRGFIRTGERRIDSLQITIVKLQTGITLNIRMQLYRIVCQRLLYRCSNWQNFIIHLNQLAGIMRSTRSFCHNHRDGLTHKTYAIDCQHWHGTFLYDLIIDAFYFRAGRDRVAARSSHIGGS